MTVNVSVSVSVSASQAGGTAHIYIHVINILYRVYISSNWTAWALSMRLLNAFRVAFFRY